MQGDGSCTAAPWGLNQQTPPSPLMEPFTQRSTLGRVTGAGEIAVIKERPSCEAAHSLARPELSGRYSGSRGSTRAPPRDTPGNEAAPRPAAPGHADTTPRMGQGASWSPPRGQSRRSRTLLKIGQLSFEILPNPRSPEPGDLLFLAADDVTFPWCSVSRVIRTHPLSSVPTRTVPSVHPGLSADIYRITHLLDGDDGVNLSVSLIYQHRFNGDYEQL
ncbi:uncharacterized protein LOC116589887 [Mustela erminea]|uniref:uncharacterized protein LOC116589887 n=1 Tax=Mustela erminea TaxID=36723 RepID=UPI001386C0BB|nr:uncharacterized protein LOC116589887 [Mustela erminea]